MVVSLANIMGSTLLKSIDLKIFYPGNASSKIMGSQCFPRGGNISTVLLFKRQTKPKPVEISTEKEFIPVDSIIHTYQQRSDYFIIS